MTNQPAWTSGPRFTAGFSLIEISIVTAIILLVAIIGVPAVTAYVVENKVPRVAEELQRFVLRLKVGAQGAGPTPYQDVRNAALAQVMRRSGVLTVNGDDDSADVSHGLGGAGRNGDGVVTLAPASSGAAFMLTLNNVNEAACPSLSSILQRIADSATISSPRGNAVIKNAIATPPVDYSAVYAQDHCDEGDTNTFSFTFR